MAGKVRVAIVGLGRIASLLEEDTKREKPCTHAGAISENIDCEIVAGCDLNPERCDEFSKRWNVSDVYTDLDELLINVKPDILHIAAYPESRWKIVKKAFKYKVPVLVCEKPLSDNLRDAGKIKKLHSSGKIKILVNHERRYSGDYIKAKTIINDKSLGELVSINSKVFIGKNKRLLDMLWHDGTHMVDIISYLSGSSLKLKKTYGDIKSRSSSYYIFSEAGSIPVILEIGASRDHLVFETELSFESGRIRIGNGVFEVYESVESKYYDGFKSLEKTESEYKGKTNYFSGMVEDAVRCFKNKSKDPISSAVHGYDVINFLNKIAKWNS